MIVIGTGPDGEKFTLFWKDDCIPSQWHPSVFWHNGLKFEWTEQWMMVKKAETFGHYGIIPDIMAATHPRECKKLGRQVHGLAGGKWDDRDKALWDRVCKPLVIQGNYLKFSQNPDMLEWLIATDGTTLVEASPVDEIWGIGLAPDDPRAVIRSEWKGENRLGDCLGEVRSSFLGVANWAARLAGADHD